MDERNTYNMPFPKRLRSLLDETHRSQQEVADFIGVSRQAVAQWKDGKTIPDMYNFKKVAKYFNVPYEYLLGETDSRIKDNIALESKLGLSDQAITTLEFLSNMQTEDNYIALSKIVSLMLEDYDFVRVLELIQKSIFEYQNYMKQEENIGMEDVTGAERDENAKFTAFGKAVIGADEMSEFHLYHALEKLNGIIRHLPEKQYEKSIGLKSRK